MKIRINSLLLSLAVAFGCLLTSCDNDDNGGVAEAVMGSTRSLEFPVSDAVPTMIAVVSDGFWQCEAPDWITVTPGSGGAGTTDVTIEVSDNTRDGAADLPRKAVLKFHGDQKRSFFEVTVRQEGDKFRDIKPSSIADMNAMEEEAAVEFENLAVLAQTNNGFVGTDGTDLVYVTGEAAQARAGQIISMLGTKMDSDTRLPFVICDRLTDVRSGDVPSIPATDITADIDSYKSGTRTLIKATGIFDGSKLNIEGKTMSVTAEDCNTDIKLSDFTGHVLTLTGVYSGTASPVVRMIVTGLEDLGLNETIYFQSNFDIVWAFLADWKGSGDNAVKNLDAMGCDNDNVYLPKITTPKVSGVSALDALKNEGWIICGGGDLTGKGTGCNFQKFYLKMGSSNKQNSATLPKIEQLGDGATGIRLSFDWSPWRDKGPADMKPYDKTEIVVIVKNGASETQFPVSTPSLAAGEKLRWHNVDMELSGVTLNKDTRIEIRNIDSQFLPNGAVSGTFRWFLNNVKVYKPKD